MKHKTGYNINITNQQGDKMDLIARTSYADQFIKTFKKYFYARRYNGDVMDCADMFRHDEWKVVGDSDYVKNTRADLIDMSSHDPELKSFIEEVIECMKYNRSMED